MNDSLAGQEQISHAPVPADPQVAGVVLAAGAGTRLRPLTLRVPKPLCQVGGVALLDHALDRVRAVCADVAVNVHAGRALMEEHLSAGPGVHVSVEEPVALGTAGAIGQLRPWLDGRAALVVNADTWDDADLAGFVSGWDGERIRVMVAGEARLGPRSRIVASLLPWSVASEIEAVPAGLYERCWAPAAASGALEVVEHVGAFEDCGTPATYLRANLEVAARAGGSIVVPGAVISPDVHVESSVIGEGAVVEGELVRSVVWPGARVHPAEALTDAVRYGTSTLLVRSRRGSAP